MEKLRKTARMTGKAAKDNHVQKADWRIVYHPLVCFMLGTGNDKEAKFAVCLDPQSHLPFVRLVKQEDTGFVASPREWHVVPVPPGSCGVYVEFHTDEFSHYAQDLLGYQLGGQPAVDWKKKAKALRLERISLRATYLKSEAEKKPEAEPEKESNS
jgi:hypothetical protein